MSKKQVIEIIKKYLQLLNNEGIPVSQAFLYGSYAKDIASPESDIDVMLISDIFERRDNKIIGKTWRLTTMIDSRIEPYLMGEKRFLSDDYSPIIEIVRQEGIKILP